MRKLEDRVALITGSARGIGFAIASAFAREGALSVIIDLNQDAVDNAVSIITGEGYKSIGFAVDVTDAQNVENVITEILKEYAKIDILVNNAGITRDGLIMKMSESDWEDVIKVNLKGTFICTQKVCRHMIKKRDGNIINISSIIGIAGNAGQANYAASKGGVIAFTKSAAKEFASRNIRVNAVAPGFIHTELTAKLPGPVVDDYLKSIPLKKVGTAADVANVCLFLASDEASYITGQTITIDGGLTM